MSNRTIGQLAKDAGVGVETIRYYHRIGLVAKPTATYKGWRRYPEQTLQLLLYIRQGQQLGFTLGELTDLLGLASAGPPRFCIAFRSAISGKIGELDRQIAELQAHRSLLAEFVVACKKREKTNQCPIVANLSPLPSGKS
jgi:MerR family mercuric resistance operon transcriptional regulator